MTRIMLLVCVLAIAACATTTTGRKPASAVPPVQELAAAPPEKKSDEVEQVLNDARPIVDNLLEGLNQSDYGKYVRDFNDSMLGAYHDAGKFRELNEKRKSKIGTSRSWNFAKAQIRRPYYIVYYKVAFTKVSEPVVLRIVFERIDNRLKIAFLTYLSPALQG